MKALTITIDDSGVTVEARGFSGRSCLKASQPYEEVLGQVTDRKIKREAHLKAAQRQSASG